MIATMTVNVRESVRAPACPRCLASRRASAELLELQRLGDMHWITHDGRQVEGEFPLHYGLLSYAVPREYLRW